MCVCVCVCTHIHTSTKERPYEDLMRKQEERAHNTEAIITLIMDFLASITVRNKSLFLSCQVYSILLQLPRLRQQPSLCSHFLLLLLF